MPPKSQFTKKQLVEAAFQIAQKKGLAGITIRAVANEAGCSVVPIYSHFTDVKELTEAVIDRITTFIMQLIDDQQSGSPFYDIGLASFKFAQMNPQLFRDLTYHQSQQGMELQRRTEDSLLALMQGDKDLLHFPKETLRRLLQHMRMHQLGMCMMIANQQIELTEQKALFYMNEVAESLIKSFREESR